MVRWLLVSGIIFGPGLGLLSLLWLDKNRWQRRNEDRGRENAESINVFPCHAGGDRRRNVLARRLQSSDGVSSLLRPRLESGSTSRCLLSCLIACWRTLSCPQL